MSTAIMASQTRENRLLPMLLITIGAVLLAANVGVVPREAPHALVHLWPAILLLGGIELLLGRRAPARALALESVVIALAVVLAVVAPESVITGGGSAGAPASGPWHAHPWR